MIVNGYYHPNKILSIKDLDGEKPILNFIQGNRTAGKTFGMKSYLINRFLKHGEKFAVLVRYRSNLQGVGRDFLAGMEFKYKGTMTEQKRNKGLYLELFYNDESCGYAIPLSGDEEIKKISTKFYEVKRMFMDEFQSTRYMPGEYDRLISIIGSVSRGEGYYRYVPVYLCSNSVSVINPYFSESGLYKQILNAPKSARIIRGHRCCLELVYNTNAKSALENAMGPLMSGKYRDSALDNEFQDNNSFVKKLEGCKYPFLTMLYNGKKFGVWQYEGGHLYVSNKIEPNLVNVIAVRDEDRNDNAKQLLPDSLKKIFKRAYTMGFIYYEDIVCKECFTCLLGKLA